MTNEANTIRLTIAGITLTIEGPAAEEKEHRGRPPGIPVTMNDRLAISAAVSDSDFLDAIRTGTPEAHTARSLADKIGISVALLCAHRKPAGHPNSRPIRRRRARIIAQLTGWPADAAHWPCGFSVRQ